MLSFSISTLSESFGTNDFFYYMPIPIICLILSAEIVTDIISSISEIFKTKVANIEHKHRALTAIELFLLIVSLPICTVSMFINLIHVLGLLCMTLKIEIITVVLVALILTVMSLINLVTIIRKKSKNLLNHNI